MKTLLLTGFEPFGGYAENPSEQIAGRLHGTPTGHGAVIESLVLPVVFHEDTARVLARLHADDQPPVAAVLSLGLAAGFTEIAVEMFAVNHRLTPDDRAAPLVPIDPAGPAAYFATVETRGMAQAIAAASGLPAAPHGYAGSYLCNHVYYSVLRWADVHGVALPCVFVHLPHPGAAVPGQAEQRFDLDAMARGVLAGCEWLAAGC